MTLTMYAIDVSTFGTCGPMPHRERLLEAEGMMLAAKRNLGEELEKYRTRLLVCICIYMYNKLLLYMTNLFRLLLECLWTQC